MAIKSYRIVTVNGRDTFIEMTAEEVAAERRASAAKEAARIAAGGCPHDGDWVHEYDSTSALGDAYFCRKCGALMQVG